MKKTILVLISLMFLGSGRAAAWGWDHCLIGYVAQEHVTPKTQEVLDRYLDIPLSEAAIWMDHFRSRAWVKKDYSDNPAYTFTSLAHAVSVDENFYPLMKSNRPDGNGDAYGEMIRCIESLKNYKNLPDSTVVVDLKLLCHIVGDIVCPGHVLHSFSKDQHDPMGGGLAAGYGIWTYKYKGKTVTLHNLLDRVAVESHPEFEGNLERYCAYLDSATPEERQAVADMPLDLWVQKHARDSKQIFEWEKPGAELDKSWFDAHESYLINIIREASYKLADVLNELFDPEYKTL